MAIVKCPSCGNSMDTSLGNCLQCGADVMPSGIKATKRNSQDINVISQLVAAVVIVAVLAGGYFLFFGQSPSPEEVREQARQDAENKRKGFHCLSNWDGSHREVKKSVQQSLRDPDSFEHVETKITPVNQQGEHMLVMRYRATNGFGGVNIGNATAIINNSNCTATVITYE